MTEGVCVCTHEAPAHWPLAPTSCSYPYCTCGEYRERGLGRGWLERLVVSVVLVLLVLNVFLWIWRL